MDPEIERLRRASGITEAPAKPATSSKPVAKPAPPPVKKAGNGMVLVTDDLDYTAKDAAVSRTEEAVDHTFESREDRYTKMAETSSFLNQPMALLPETDAELEVIANAIRSEDEILELPESPAPRAAPTPAPRQEIKITSQEPVTLKSVNEGEIIFGAVQQGDTWAVCEINTEERLFVATGLALEESAEAIAILSNQGALFTDQNMRDVLRFDEDYQLACDSLRHAEIYGEEGEADETRKTVETTSTRIRKLNAWLKKSA